MVGFDDIPVVRFPVSSLTTVRLPASDMASRCGAMIIGLTTTGALVTSRQVFQAEVVASHSCGARSMSQNVAYQELAPIGVIEAIGRLG